MEKELLLSLLKKKQAEQDMLNAALAKDQAEVAADAPSDRRPLFPQADMKLPPEVGMAQMLRPQMGEVKAAEANLPDVVEQRNRFERIMQLMGRK